jgi:hypothetical protein
MFAACRTNFAEFVLTIIKAEQAWFIWSLYSCKMLCTALYITLYSPCTRTLPSHSLISALYLWLLSFIPLFSESVTVYIHTNPLNFMTRRVLMSKIIPHNQQIFKVSLSQKHFKTYGSMRYRFDLVRGCPNPELQIATATKSVLWRLIFVGH